MIDCRRLILLTAFAAVLSAPAFAKAAKKGGGSTAGAKGSGSSAAGGSCPAANKVNTHTEEQLGCPVVLARSIGPQWELATKADFVKQSGGRPFAEEKAAGTGGIRCAKFYRKRKGKTASIHRLYGGGAREFGGYWTFEAFKPHAAGYREQFAICKDWNDLSHSVECKLGASTEVVIAVGPGQSVGPRQARGKDGKLACVNVCADAKEKYAASHDLQVVLFGGDRFCNKP